MASIVGMDTVMTPQPANREAVAIFVFGPVTSGKGQILLRRPLDPTILPDHIDVLYRAAWALCGSRNEAEDLVQDTFARVLKRPRLLRSDERRRIPSARPAQDEHCSSPGRHAPPDHSPAGRA